MENLIKKHRLEDIVTNVITRKKFDGHKTALKTERQTNGLDRQTSLKTCRHKMQTTNRQTAFKMDRQTDQTTDGQKDCT